MPLHFSEQFGFSDQDFADVQSKREQAAATVREMNSKGELGFTKLPYANIDQIISLANELRSEFADVVLIGIGGSDLGSRAVHRALNSPYFNLNEQRRNGSPRLFFTGDTTDPVALSEVIEEVDWNHACVILVSKSGNTVEQMSTFVLLRQRLLDAVGDNQTKRAIITITDGEKGTLHDVTIQEGYRTLAVPGDVGGRFSVLTSAGLLPLAVAGIDIQGLLKGAADMSIDDDRPLAYATLQYLAYTKREQRIHVFMPYTYSLREVGFWFRQLWAESLGKAYAKDGQEVHSSPTPIASVGPTDQHSQVQLYREGLNDKTYTFVVVKEVRVDYTLPEAFSNFEGVAYLKGHSMNEILHAEQRSTDQSLKEVGRPTCLIELDRMDAYHVGQLLFFLELATAYAGEMVGINTYDQPGVERGKELMYQILGR